MLFPIIPDTAGPQTYLLDRGTFASRAAVATVKGTLVAPALGAIVADSGPLSAGQYLVYAFHEYDNNANNVNLGFFERNAANSADVDSWPAQNPSAAVVFFQMLAVMAGGERLVFRTSAAAAAGEHWTASMLVFPV